ncbi:hypothetical protein ACFL5O_07190 [Myxococcota bacterium]
MPVCRFIAVAAVLAAVSVSNIVQAEDCADDADCLQGFECVDVGGVSCTDYDCDPDVEDCPESVCTEEVNLQCRPASCEEDSDCAADMVCQKTTSRSCSQMGVACAPDMECPEPEPPVCEETTMAQCVPRWTLPCSEAADCGEGFTCEPMVICECAGTGSGGSAGVAVGAEVVMDTPVAADPAPAAATTNSTTTATPTQPVDPTAGVDATGPTRQGPDIDPEVEGELMRTATVGDTEEMAGDTARDTDADCSCGPSPDQAYCRGVDQDCAVDSDCPGGWTCQEMPQGPIACFGTGGAASDDTPSSGATVAKLGTGGAASDDTPSSGATVAKLGTGGAASDDTPSSGATVAKLGTGGAASDDTLSTGVEVALPGSAGKRSGDPAVGTNSSVPIPVEADGGVADEELGGDRRDDEEPALADEREGEAVECQPSPPPELKCVPPYHDLGYWGVGRTTGGMTLGGPDEAEVFGGSANSGTGIVGQGPMTVSEASRAMDAVDDNSNKASDPDGAAPEPRGDAEEEVIASHETEPEEESTVVTPASGDKKPQGGAVKADSGSSREETETGSQAEPVTTPPSESPQAGGGCQVGVGSAANSGWWVGLLGLFGLGWRRRRRGAGYQQV